MIRRIKVYEAPSREKRIPQIRLQGKWLKDVGYEVGDYIQVTIIDNSIVI